MSLKNKLLVETPASAVKDWMMGLRQALFDAVSEADVREIAANLVKKAKEGDLSATKLLLTYVVGNGGLSVKNTIIVQNEEQLAGLTSARLKALPNGNGRN
jgi:hypothetical protein